MTRSGIWWIALGTLPASGCYQTYDAPEVPGADEIISWVNGGDATMRIANVACAQSRPADELAMKTYDCSFVRTAKKGPVKECSIKMELAPDEHYEVWKDAKKLNSSTNEPETSLSCT